MTVMICPKCQDVRIDGKFCPADGAELVEYAKHSCGTVVLPFHEFCAGCGERLPAGDVARMKTLRKTITGLLEEARETLSSEGQETLSREIAEAERELESLERKTAQ